MNSQEIRLVAQRQHLRQVELVEIREDQQRVRMVIRARGSTPVASAANPPNDQAPLPAAASADCVTVKASFLGVLRLSHPLRSPSRVEPGDVVTTGQPLALLEIRGVYSDVVSPCDGVVESVLAADGARVDFGMPLFTLKAPSR